jgi:hypothetical protein
MSSKVATLMPIVLLILSLRSIAQGPCPTATVSTTAKLSSDSICTITQVYGAGGLVGRKDGGPLDDTDTGTFKHVVHFQSSSLSSFSPLTAEIGTQLSQLPLTSPASGFIYSLGATGGITATTQNFGPILSERAQTIGKHRLFVGFSYQYFNFDKVDGVNLKHFGAVFTHEPEACLPNNPTLTCASDGQVLPTKDFVETSNRIDLKVHQFTAVGTLGITDRFDLSVAIPILDVRMDMGSDATIISFETATDNPPCCVHQFDPSQPIEQGEHLFPANPQFGNNHASFFRATSAAGIGDVTFRGKYELLKREKMGVAAGLDVRVPTGDELNFLGSGTWGVRPFGAISFSGRFAPRANIGYLFNGDSVLGGNISENTSDRLPSVLTYSFGADYGISPRLSLSGDFLGQTLINAKRITGVTFTDFFKQNTVPNISAASRANVNQASLAAGAKINPFGKLLVTANVLFRVNDAGLHSKPVPLIGLSYTF